MHQRKCCCRARELTTDCVCRLLIMGRACGSIYFIFMSQMVHVVLFMNKLGVQNTSVSKAVCRMQRGGGTKKRTLTCNLWFCWSYQRFPSRYLIIDPEAVYPALKKGYILFVHHSGPVSVQQLSPPTSSSEAKYSPFKIFGKKKKCVYCTGG